jgi:hypothetical protein
MPDPEFNLSRPALCLDGAPAAGSADPYPRATCRKCGAHLTLLPKVARFCNRCGTTLAPPGATILARPSTALQPPRAPRFAWPRWLFNLWFACLEGGDGVTHSASEGRSAVLLAYGKSLFNLGWRYEHAIGARRNLAEAARCYWKAARLGDPSAAGRLQPTRVQACPNPSLDAVPTPCPVS